MNEKLFGLEVQCIQDTVKLDDDEISVLRSIAATLNSDASNLVSKLLEIILKDNWMEYYSKGLSIREWFCNSQKERALYVYKQLLDLEAIIGIEGDVAVDAIWLMMRWTDQSMGTGVYLQIAISMVKEAEVPGFIKVIQAIRDNVDTIWGDRTWQERKLLFNHLCGLETRLSELEVQHVLLK